MKQKEKTGGAYAALLLLTVAFLASLAWLSARGEVRVSAAEGYTVAVEKNVPAALLGPPVTQRVNVNTATAEELEALPGIGPVLARRIVDYRAEHGAFASEGELLEVEGIGGAKLDAMRNNITLEKGETP